MKGVNIMARMYKMMYAIIIGGNFMKGRIYTKTREEAFSRLESEVQIGYEKLKAAEKYTFNSVYSTMDKRYLRGIDGYVGEYLACADDYEKYITYKVSKVRVPV